MFCSRAMRFAFACLVACRGVSSAEDAPRYRPYVLACLDTLIEHGTDRYGQVRSPLFMAILDAESRASPEKPLYLDSLARFEPERLHRRSERGANPWYDQRTLAAMYWATRITGDRRYAEAADACLRFFLKRCLRPNGLPYWGTHVFWDAFADAPGGDGNGAGPHEILVYHPLWLDMYRIDPAAVRGIGEALWTYHVWDKATGAHNRHDDGQKGCDFAFSGGSLVLAFASLNRATGDAKWLERAKLVAGWHWRHRDPTTGLVPDAPSTGDRYDATHCFTTVTGPHAAQLLHAHELTGEAFFRDAAFSYITAYEKYGWDETARTYRAMLRLDGTPIGDKVRGEGYDAWAPYGPVDVWRVTLYSYEFPLIAAQASVYAYEVSRGGGAGAGGTGGGDTRLLAAAQRWAGVIERALPPSNGRRWVTELEQGMPEAAKAGGTYAENYGQGISFYVHLWRASRDAKLLGLARRLADEAVAKLYRNGIFTGHPAKPYYEATNGVGILLWSLLELDAPEATSEGAF